MFYLDVERGPPLCDHRLSVHHSGHFAFLEIIASQDGLPLPFRLDLFGRLEASKCYQCHTMSRKVSHMLSYCSSPLSIEIDRY